MTHNPFFMIGIVLAVLVLFICFISPLFVRYDAEGTSLSERFLPPEGFANGLDGHVFGTDQLGRDVFTRLLTGGTASLLIAACAVFLQVFFGSVLGILAGYLGGWVDKVIMRACDVFLAIPNIILAIAVMSVMGTSVFNLIAVLTISGWVLEQVGRVPEVGDHFEAEGLDVTVTQVEHRRVLEIRVMKLPESEEHNKSR